MLARPFAMVLAPILAGTISAACVDKQARAQDTAKSPRATAPALRQSISVIPSGSPLYPPAHPAPLPPRTPPPEPPIVLPAEGGAECMTDEGAPFVAPRC